jgi:capsular exopolysaccharide synthesis family protein
MSRFYQALREAGFGLHPVEGTPRTDKHTTNLNGAGVPVAVNASEENGIREPQSISAHQSSAAADDALPRETGIRVIPHGKLDRSARAIPNTENQAVVESYRSLRTKLLQQQAAEPFHTLLLTSSNPQEGKTVTTLNLAFSFSMLPGFKVLLVDGDLRRGSLGTLLGADGYPGLSNLIEGSAAFEDVVLKNPNTPHILPRGTSNASPAELLHSPHLGAHFGRLADYFSLVLIDSPPVNLVTDAHLLAASCDAVLVVARAFVTTRKGLEKAVQELQPFRILGTVLNCGTRAQTHKKYRGYY